MRLYEIRRHQRRRRRRKALILSIFAFLVLGLAILLFIGAKAQNGAPGEPTEASYEVITVDPKPVSSPATSAEAEPGLPEFSYSKDWDAEDSYLLAKIAMAEAEGETTYGKTLVILVVLNRVWSDDFPDTIREVIFQKNQFSPVGNGRFDAVEPDADCWAAVEVVMEARYDYSEGALYFESCKADSWHSRNLKFLYQYGNHKFYK